MGREQTTQRRKYIPYMGDCGILNSVETYQVEEWAGRKREKEAERCEREALRGKVHERICTRGVYSDERPGTNSVQRKARWKRRKGKSWVESVAAEVGLMKTLSKQGYKNIME